MRAHCAWTVHAHVILIRYVNCVFEVFDNTVRRSVPVECQNVKLGVPMQLLPHALRQSSIVLLPHVYSTRTVCSSASVL